MDWEDFKSKSLDDMGTRYQHYSDLLSVWQEGAVLISEYSHVGKHDQAKLDTLNMAVELLQNTMDGIGEYHDRVLSLRKLIDFVPTDPSVIPEGRGTPLRRQQLGTGEQSDKS